MNCLHCGDCCLRMSPVANPCPHLIEPRPGYYFCGINDHKPTVCASHDFPSRHCPIGASKLGITSLDAIRERIDTGWELIKHGFESENLIENESQ